MADGLGFARKQLEKHGWSEGKGLGKEESGISKAIKVNVKTDLAGVGYDAGDQFSFHWWDHVFNKTAKSIVVQESEEGVKVVKSSKEACSVSNKRPSKNTNKPRLYGRFVKASCQTQTQENKTQESDDDSESEKDFSHLCPDERLFQACGGRTAHKAARHGLLLNGKLQRVEKQEKIGNSDVRCDSDTAKRSVLDLKSFVVRDEKQRCKEGKRDSKESKKGKMKKRKYREMLEEENRKLDEVVDDRADLIQSRKKNVKNIVMNGEGDHKLEVHSSCDDYEKVKKGKKKRKCRDLQKGKEYKLEGERDFCGDMAKNQKKKRTKNGDVHGTNDEALSDICFYTNNLDEEGVNSKKRKRKDQLGENDYKLEGTCPDPKYDVDKKRAKKKKKKTLIYRKRTGADFRKVK